MKILPQAQKRQQRIAKILQILQENHISTVPEIAQRLSMSPMTIRRDLSFLHEEKVVRMFHGGTVLNPDRALNFSWEMSYLLSEQKNIMKAQKVRIGKKAASLLEADDVVIMDAGSTTLAFASEIPENIKLTVLCFSLSVLAELQRRKNCRLIITGGYYHDDTTMFESVEGLQLIKKIRANKAFIAASGISSSLGVTCTDAYQVENKKAALGASQTKILLADSSKFGKVQHAFFADLKDFNIIITDSAISAEYADIVKNLGIELIIV
jgi:DeoR family deoxyribose operon repressor